MSENNNNNNANTEHLSTENESNSKFNLLNNGNFSFHPTRNNNNNNNNKSHSHSHSRKRTINDASLDTNTNANKKQKLNENHAKKLSGLEAYEKLSKLGEGTYGIVYMARDRRTNEFVALKRIRTGLNENKTGFPITSIREIKILGNLDHINIVTLREVVRSSNIGYIFLVFEYYEHDLAYLMDAHNVSFTMSEIKCIILQLLSAVDYAHKHFVIHRDIKLSNILLNNRGNIVLCDWGLARLYSSQSHMTTKVVTLWYRAPELLFGCNIYHTAVDIWAIGCIIAELFKNKPLLPGQNELNQIQLIYQLLGVPNQHIWPNYMSLPKISDGTYNDVNLLNNNSHKYKYNQIDTLFGMYKANCLDLMKQLLAYDPSKRINAENAIKHPFFKEMPYPSTKDMMPTFPAKVNQNNNNKFKYN